MDNELDFVPPVFFRVFALVTGLYVLTFTAVVLFQSFTSVFSSFSRNLAPNLNRLGLIFELVGLFSLLPDLMDRTRLVSWEQNLNKMSVRSISIGKFIAYLRLNLSLSSTTQTEGMIGFAAQLSRLLGVLLISVAAIEFQKIGLNEIKYPLLTLSAIGYLWLLIEIVNWKFQLTRDDITKMSLKLIRAIVLWACLGLAFFIPILVISLIITSLLIWVASNPLSKVIATITFPFILIGTICQLIASFL
jgi:hypothetical protein